MRIIEEKMLEAIKHKKDWRRDNTEVIWFNKDTLEVRLYGNRIAKFIQDEEKPCKWLCSIYDGRHQTNTTKSRLNAILDYFGTDCCIAQRNYEWYILRKWDKNPIPFPGEFQFEVTL